MKLLRLLLAIALLASCASGRAVVTPYTLTVKVQGRTVYGPAALQISEEYVTLTLQGVACPSNPAISPMVLRYEFSQCEDGLLHHYCSSNCYVRLSGEATILSVAPGSTVTADCDGAELSVLRANNSFKPKPLRGSA